MTDENKNNSIDGHYKHEKKNSQRTGCEFHVNSASYAWWENHCTTHEYLWWETTT